MSEKKEVGGGFYKRFLQGVNLVEKIQKKHKKVVNERENNAEEYQ